MINLEPIPANIQRRLKQKQNVLSRKTREFNIGESQSSSDLPSLTYDTLATKTPFLRMSSGLEKPVILMGGELKEDNTIPSGYNEIYSSRLKRPVAGVKSVDAEFLGGSKATRRATISWTCWSFEDIDRLTPHFLQHGHSVLVEWGWVYDKTNIQELPNFRKITGFEGGQIKPDVYKNYRDKIIESYGDIDVMAGVISNYEYTTRADGGFDCQTIITSLGVNLFKRVEKQQEDQDNSVIIDVSRIFNNSSDDKDTTTVDNTITINTNTTFKAFLTTIDSFLFNQIETIGDGLAKGYGKGGVARQDNNFLIRIGDPSSFTGGLIDNAWVRWGWFEDNILSQFTALTNSKSEIVSRFRSVEQIDDNVYESVKIRNHDYLETISYNDYILPGQFYPLKTREITDGTQTLATLKGDNLKNLASEVNNFKPFSTLQEQNNNLVERQGIEDTNLPAGGRHGYLRNILVSTRLIKQAFGTPVPSIDAKDIPEISPMNILQGIESVFNKINSAGGLGMWNFQIQQDEVDGERLKVIDDTTTHIDFTNPDPLTQLETKFKEDLTIQNNQPGIFYFPIWRTDSIVKAQNISARIPSALQIATMYGSGIGIDFKKEPENVASNHDSVGVIAGAIGGKEVDTRFKGTDIALRNTHLITNNKTENKELIAKANTSSELINWLNDDKVSQILTATFNEKAKEKDKLLKNQVFASLHKNIKDTYEKTRPISYEFFTDEQISSLFKSENYNEFFEIPLSENTVPENFVGPLQSGIRADEDTRRRIVAQLQNAFRMSRREFEKFFTTKYDDDGLMKAEFANSVKDKISYTTTSNNDNLPMLIPLEIELELDGIGGIYPGNSFHSTYLPQRYQDRAVFQIVSVNHNVSESGWQITLIGKMRTSIAKVLGKESEEFTQDDINLDIFKKKFKLLIIEEGDKLFTFELQSENFKNKIKALDKSPAIQYSLERKGAGGPI